MNVKAKTISEVCGKSNEEWANFIRTYNEGEVMTEKVETVEEQWKPLVDYYRSNGIKKEDIDELVKRLDEKKDKFVHKTFFDKGIYNGIIAQWKKDRNVRMPYRI